MYCMIYNCRSKIHDNKSIKAKNGKIEVRHYKFLALDTKQYNMLENQL